MSDENFVMPRDNSRRAQIILICFYILAGIDTFGFVSSYMQYGLLQRAVVGDISIPEVQANEMRQQIYVVLYLFMLIMCVVTFIMWFRRAYANLHRVGNIHLSQSEGWAAGAWFVPFLNLVRPFIIMKEIWVETQEYINDGESPKNSSLVGAWWAVWLLSNFTSTILTSISDTKSLDGLLQATSFGMALIPIKLAAILLVVLVIRNVSSFEKKMYAYFEEKQDHVDISSHLIE